MAKPLRLDANNNLVEQEFLFTELGDVPADYTGKGGQYVRVNDTEDGLEFSDDSTWTLADLAYPPPIWLDPSVESTVTTPTGSAILTSIASQFNPTTYVGTAGTAVNLIRSSAVFGSLPAISMAGSGTSWITITGGNDIGRNKGALTLLFLGVFHTSGTGRSLIHVGTPSSDLTRATISTSTTTGTVLRMAGRRLDADSSVGADVGGSQGSGFNTGSPFLAIWEYDYANAAARAYLNGVLVHTISPFQTAGTTSNTASDVVRFGGASSGFLPPVIMQCGGISDTIYSTDDRQRIEGYLLHRARLDYLLPSAHPYRGTPPFTPGLSFAEAMSIASLEP